MLHIQTDPSEVAVTLHRSTERPREIRVAGERLAVTALETVRDETAAYPLRWGPRTVYVLRAGGRRYRLVHLVRDHRWTLEQLGPSPMELARVA
jgi:hypothetical protein